MTLFLSPIYIYNGHSEQINKIYTFHYVVLMIKIWNLQMQGSEKSKSNRDPSAHLDDLLLNVKQAGTKNTLQYERWLGWVRTIFNIFQAKPWSTLWQPAKTDLSAEMSIKPILASQCMRAAIWCKAHLSSFLYTAVDLLQEVSLSASLGISDGGGICGLCDEQVRPALVYPSCPKMPVWCHVVITLKL